MSMSNNSTFLTVRRQTSPPFHVEACLPFTNREMDYSAVAIWSKRKTSNGDIGSTLHLQLLEVVRKHSFLKTILTKKYLEENNKIASLQSF